MKKKLLIVGAVAFILAACSGNQKKLDEDSIKIADLTAEYEEATSFNDSLMLLMGDIYTGLDSINTQEGLLYNMGNSLLGQDLIKLLQLLERSCAALDGIVLFQRRILAPAEGIKV